MQESHLSSHQPAWPAHGQGREADNGGRLCYTYGLITSNSSDRCCDDSKLIWKLIIKARIILPPIWFWHHGTWPATGHSTRCRALLLTGLTQWKKQAQVQDRSHFSVYEYLAKYTECSSALAMTTVDAAIAFIFPVGIPWAEASPCH